MWGELEKERERKKKTEYKGGKTELREERRRAFSKEDIKGTERGGRGSETESYGRK